MIVSAGESGINERFLAADDNTYTRYPRPSSPGPLTATTIHTTQQQCSGAVGSWRTLRERSLAADMGLLTDGTPLSWPQTKKYADHVRQHGIEQFINQYHQLKGRQGDCLKWGDEVGVCCSIHLCLPNRNIPGATLV